MIYPINGSVVGNHTIQMQCSILNQKDLTLNSVKTCQFPLFEFFSVNSKDESNTVDIYKYVLKW